MKTMALVFTLIAVSASAASYRIERIDINAAKRIPAAAVLAETRLEAGRTYTDEQLQQAMNRVARLPFVLFATADLKPGSAPDARVLRINVEETAALQLTADLTGIVTQNHHGHGEVNAGVGYHFFPTSNGMAEADISATNAAYFSGTQREGRIAYDAWGLFGTRAYARVAAGTVFRTNGRHDFNPSLLAGVPLTQTQSIEAAFARTTVRADKNYPNIPDTLHDFARFTSAGLTWLQQTSDDPYFPRKGYDVDAGVGWQRNEIATAFVLAYPPPAHAVFSALRERQLNYSAGAIAYRPLREASSAWGELRASTLRATNLTNAANSGYLNIGDAMLGVAHNVDRDLGESGQHRTRLDFGIGYHYEKSNSGYDNSGAAAEVGWTYRSRNGVLRFVATYVTR